MNTPDAPQTSPEAPANARGWLSVAVAAARLGVSARAIQKRCASGKMAARRVAVPGGVRWEVDGRELSREPTNEPGANPANFGREPANQKGQPRELHVREGANRDANPRTDGREPDANTRELLERERQFSAFLKAQLEEANRNAAELRAALRKALEIAPRQLAAPSPVEGFEPVRTQKENAGEQFAQVRAEKSGEVGTSWHRHASARNAQNGPQNGEVGNDDQGASSAPKSKSRSLSYGDIADLIEKELSL